MANEESVNKRNRKRSNVLFNQLRQQMEFYFSDANLNKDRFLKQQLEQSPDGYLPLEMFLSFNKIRAMTSSVETLVKAVKKSEMLKVNEEKNAVRRTTEILKAEDVDARTVYVECLPAGVNHEWVKEAFSECGKVLYVSLPKFKSTRDIKGFAFVEFDSEESASRACTIPQENMADLQGFTQMKRLKGFMFDSGRCSSLNPYRKIDINIMNNPPVTASDLVGIFPKASKEERRLEKQAKRLEYISEPRKRHISEGDVTTAKNLSPDMKRRRTGSLSHDRTEEGAEKNRAEAETAADKKSCDMTEQKKKNRKRERQNSSEENVPDVKKMSSAERGSEDSENFKVECSSDGKSKKKKEDCSVKAPGESGEESLIDRKQSKKRRKSCDDDDDVVNTKKSKSEADDMESSDVKEAEKGEKSDAESNEASDVKKKKRSKKHQENKNKNSESDKVIPELRVISKKDWLNRKAEYLQHQKENMAKLKEKINKLKDPSGTGNKRIPSNQKTEPKPDESKLIADKAGDNPKMNKTEFKPATVLKITSEQPITRKEIKERLSEFGSIAYVDVIDGTLSARVRCNDAKSAENILSSQCSDLNLTLLTGTEEEDYWKKLEADRTNKFSKASKTKRRGRDRVLARADQCLEKKNAKHVVFG